MHIFLENPREFLKTLYKSLNSPQDSIRNDSIDCLMKFLKFLFEFLGIQPLNNRFPLEEDFGLQRNIENIETLALSGSVEKNFNMFDENHLKINMSSVVEENNGSSLENIRNSEDFGLNFFEDSILSSPTFEETNKKARKSSILREQPGFGEEDWFEILYNLKEKFKDSVMKVRENALEGLFSILLSFGYSFQADFWIRVYREIIRKSFEELVRDFLMHSMENIEINVLRFLLKKAIFNLAKMQGLYLTENDIFLTEFLDIIAFLLNVRNEFLVKLALGALKSVISKIAHKFSRNCWKLIVNFLCESLEDALPKQLMNKENLDLGFPKNCGDLIKGFGSAFAIFRPINLGFDPKEVVTKSLEILLILGIIKEININALAIEVFSLIY